MKHGNFFHSVPNRDRERESVCKKNTVWKILLKRPICIEKRNTRNNPQRDGDCLKWNCVKCHRSLLWGVPFIIQVRFAYGKPLRASATGTCSVGTSVFFALEFFFSHCQQQQKQKKSISFIWITPRSCCSLVLISIVVVIKMLKHCQTYGLARQLLLSGFGWWSLQCTCSTDEMITIEWDGKWKNPHCLLWHGTVGNLKREIIIIDVIAGTQCSVRLFVWSLLTSNKRMMAALSFFYDTIEISSI